MSKSNLLKSLVNQLCEALPTHLQSFKKDFEKNCRNVLDRSFSKLDLVTREEFDIQSKVLLRTRKKLEELERRLKSYEDALKDKQDSQ